MNTASLAELRLATIPVEPDTALIASLSDVKLVVATTLALTVEAVELLPLSVKLKLAPPDAIAALAIFALVIAVALTPVVPAILLKAEATSLASAPAATSAVFVQKEPLTR